MQWRQEAITLARHSFDKAGIFCVVLDCGAKLLQSCVQASIEIDMGAVLRHSLAEFVSLYNFAVSPKEHGENSKGLFLDFDTYALAAQGRAGKVCFEQTKFHDWGGINLCIGFQQVASPGELCQRPYHDSWSGARD